MLLHKHTLGPHTLEFYLICFIVFYFSFVKEGEISTIPGLRVGMFCLLRCLSCVFVSFNNIIKKDILRPIIIQSIGFRLYQGLQKPCFISTINLPFIVSLAVFVPCAGLLSEACLL